MVHKICSVAHIRTDSGKWMKETKRGKEKRSRKEDRERLHMSDAPEIEVLMYSFLEVDEMAAQRV